MGRSPISPSVARHLFSALRSPATGVDETQPTARESHILAGVAEGRSHQEITARLGLSTHAVNHPIRNVSAKLRVNRSSEAPRPPLPRGCPGHRRDHPTPGTPRGTRPRRPCLNPPPPNSSHTHEPRGPHPRPRHGECWGTPARVRATILNLGTRPLGACTPRLCATAVRGPKSACMQDPFPRPQKLRLHPSRPASRNIPARSGCSSMVERGPPMPEARVRFPSPAPFSIKHLRLLLDF